MFHLRAGWPSGPRLSGKCPSPTGLERVPVGMLGQSPVREEPVSPSPPSDGTAEVGGLPTSANRERGGRDAAVGACAVAPIHAGESEDPYVYDGKLAGRPVRILLDGGAAANFLSARVAAEMGLPLKDTVEDGVGYARMPDGTRHRCKATNLLRLRIGGDREDISFNVIELEDHEVILGKMWSRLHDPRRDGETAEPYGRVEASVIPCTRERMRRRWTRV